MKHPSIRCYLTLALLLASIGISHADFDAGMAAYLRQDYATALREFKPPAEQGHVKARYILGYMYFDGQGVPQDYKAAVQWLSKAAEQNWDASAQNHLGYMYSNGLGVAQDYKAAVQWYSRAAEQGDASAQRNLGLRYYQGQGVPQDNIRAHMWTNLAASNGADTKDRDRIAAEMTPDEIKKAQQLARTCLESNYQNC